MSWINTPHPFVSNILIIYYISETKTWTLVLTKNFYLIFNWIKNRFSQFVSLNTNKYFQNTSLYFGFLEFRLSLQRTFYKVLS